MGRISNTDLYPQDQNITGNDSLIGSDGDNNDATRNYSLEDIATFVGQELGISTTQNNIVREIVVGTVADQDDPTSEINGLPSFTVLDTEIVIFSATFGVPPDDVPIQYALRTGTGTYGSGGTALTNTDILRLTSTIGLATQSSPGQMSSGDKTKLDGIATGAEVNVQADWNETDTNDDSFIQNKPTDLTDLSTHSVTELNDVTDAGSGVIISLDERNKLTGIEDNATADQTGSEIVTSINTELGNTDWQSPGAGTANLGYTSAVDEGTVTNTAGTDATIPAGSTLNASLMLPSDKVKLNGVANNAEVNVQSDWNETDTGSDTFIQNKPTDVTNLATHSVTELSDVTNAGSGQIITSTERTNFQGIIDGINAATALQYYGTNAASSPGFHDLPESEAVTGFTAFIGGAGASDANASLENSDRPYATFDAAITAVLADTAGADGWRFVFQDAGTYFLSGLYEAGQLEPLNDFVIESSFATTVEIRGNISITDRFKVKLPSGTFTLIPADPTQTAGTSAAIIGYSSTNGTLDLDIGTLVLNSGTGVGPSRYIRFQSDVSIQRYFIRNINRVVNSSNVEIAHDSLTRFSNIFILEDNGVRFQIVNGGQNINVFRLNITFAGTGTLDINFTNSTENLFLRNITTTNASPATIRIYARGLLTFLDGTIQNPQVWFKNDAVGDRDNIVTGIATFEATKALGSEGMITNSRTMTSVSDIRPADNNFLKNQLKDLKLTIQDTNATPGDFLTAGIISNFSENPTTQVVGGKITIDNVYLRIVAGTAPVFRTYYYVGEDQTIHGLVFKGSNEFIHNGIFIDWNGGVGETINADAAILVNLGANVRYTGTSFSDHPDLAFLQIGNIPSTQLDTWTPTLTESNAVVTYTFNTVSARWYRVGQVVHFQLHLNTIDASGTPTGSFRIQGLPFTLMDGTGAATIAILRNLTGTQIETNENVFAELLNVSSTLTIQFRSTGITTGLPIGTSAGQGQISLSGSYLIQ